MKTKQNKQNKEKKQLRELSEEELKEVTGGASIDCSLPENKKKYECFRLINIEKKYLEMYVLTEN